MRFSLRDVLAGAGDIIARQAGDNNGQAESDSSRVSPSDTQSSTTGSNNVLNLPDLVNPLVGGLLPAINPSTTSTDPVQAQTTESVISSDDSTVQPTSTPAPEVPSPEPTPEPTPEPAPEVTEAAPSAFPSPVPSPTVEADPESITSISTPPAIPPLLTTPETTTSSILKSITTPKPLPTTLLRSTTSLSNPTSSPSTFPTANPLALSQNQAPPATTGPSQTLVIALAVGISVFIVLLAGSLFTLHRVFRKRRVGRRADSPPPSPMMANAATFPGEEYSRASSPSSYMQPGIAGIMGGGRAKAGGMVLPKNF